MKVLLLTRYDRKGASSRLRFQYDPLTEDAKRAPGPDQPMPKLRKRIVEDLIASRLRTHGGVLITGPKAVGITTIARTIAASEVPLDQDRAELIAARTTDGNSLPTGRFCSEHPYKLPLRRHRHFGIRNRSNSKLPQSSLLTTPAAEILEAPHLPLGRAFFGSRPPA